MHEDSHRMRLFTGFVILLSVAFIGFTLLGMFFIIRDLVTMFPTVAAGLIGFNALAYVVGWAFWRWA